MTVTSDAEVYYDPYDFEIDSDPYPVWKRLRDEAPLYWNDKYEFFAVSRWDDVDAASPALQQADRGVERPASGRRTVVPDHEVQEPRGRHSSGHGGTLLCCRGVSGQTLMRSFLAFLTGQPRVREG